MCRFESANAYHKSCSVATGAKNASQVYFYGKVILIQSLLATSGIAKLFFLVGRILTCFATNEITGGDFSHLFNVKHMHKILSFIRLKKASVCLQVKYAIQVTCKFQTQ